MCDWVSRGTLQHPYSTQFSAPLSLTTLLSHSQARILLSDTFLHMFDFLHRFWFYFCDRVSLCEKPRLVCDFRSPVLDPPLWGFQALSHHSLLHLENSNYFNKVSEQDIPVSQQECGDDSLPLGATLSLTMVSSVPRWSLLFQVSNQRLYTKY